MIYFIAEALGVIGVALVRLLPFNDARLALEQGVFSATSTIDYSIMRSVFSYAVFLAICALSALVYVWLSRKQKSSEMINIQPVSVRIGKWEALFVMVVIIALSVLSVIFREKVFTFDTLHSEEFYNLAAAVELKSGNFDIIYPYSVGNLLVVNMIGSAFGLLGYKLFLNALAVVATYWLICRFVSSKKFRFVIFSWLIVFFLQTLVSPTLHRNLLRFLIPVIAAVGVHYISEKKFKNILIQVLSLAFFIFLILFFGSADTIAVSAAVYLLFTIILIFRRMSTRELSPWFLAPVLGLLFMIVLSGIKYLSLLQSQLRSISVYSGYANTAPYFDFFSIFHQLTATGFLKSIIYLPIFYLPIAILGSVIIFLVMNFKHYGLRNNFFTTLLLLTIAFAVYFRQNFGDAGAGRISITSIVLVFIILVLVNFKIIESRRIIFISLGFFIIFTVVNLYFLRQNIVYYLNFYQRSTRHADLVECNSAKFGRELNLAGYDWCDPRLVSTLTSLIEKMGSNSFYVYDDTFSLYYIFDARPVVLIPSYYMAYSNEAFLVEKMEKLQTKYLIYLKNLNFFGVPEAAIADEKFMKVINVYRDNKFNLVESNLNYKLYERK